MEKVKSVFGNDDIIKRNHEYILLAKQTGFFKDGYDKNDIWTCSDSIVIHWIDELDEKKEDKERFTGEILPAFKRWISNGLESTGVGSEYDLLKLAERHGIKITYGSFICIISLIMEKSLSLNNKYSNYQEISNHFQIKEILENLVRLNKNGIPIIYPLSRCYDQLIALEEKEELVNFDTFMFFYTSGYQTFNQDMELYEDKKCFEEKYGYSTCNGDEVKRLNNWLRYVGGYNVKYVDELYNKITKWQEKITRYGLSRVKEQIGYRKGKKVTVSYISLDSNGNKESNKISGLIDEYSDDSITLKVPKESNDEFDKITISDNDTTIISKISYNSVYLYECRTLKERMSILKTKLKIEEIKNQDVASKYIERFKTIEGLGYLKTSGLAFLTLVNEEQFPIDNLFTYCFELIHATFSGTMDSKEFLQYTLAAYNKMMSGEIESLKDCNFGYPINKFLSEDVLEIAKRVCLYVVSENIKAEFPSEYPPQPMSPNTVDGTNVEQHIQDSSLNYNNEDLNTEPILGRVR